MTGKYCRRKDNVVFATYRFFYGKKPQRIGPTLFDKFMIYIELFVLIYQELLNSLEINPKYGSCQARG